MPAKQPTTQAIVSVSLPKLTAAKAVSYKNHCLKGTILILQEWKWHIILFESHHETSFEPLKKILCQNERIDV